MNRGLKMLAISSARDRMREPVQDNYDVDSRFRDRRGREHYDDGRFAPQSNANRWMPPYYDVEINRYDHQQAAPRTAMRDDHRMEMRGDYNSDRRDRSRMDMGGYGGMEMGEYVNMNMGGYGEMEMNRGQESRRNPVGFAAHFDSPGSSDASYQRMDEMSHRSGSKMDHGGAMSHQMPKFDERTAREWVSKMENEDGTRGPHWTMDQTTKVMEQRGIKEDPVKFYAVLNMMYSDFCEVAKKVNANSMDFYAEMAKAFLKDKDVGAQDKLAAYYEYIVKG